MARDLIPGFAGPSPEEKGEVNYWRPIYRFSFGETVATRVERFILNLFDEVQSHMLDFRSQSLIYPIRLRCASPDGPLSSPVEGTGEDKLVTFKYHLKVARFDNYNLLQQGLIH